MRQAALLLVDKLNELNPVFIPGMPVGGGPFYETREYFERYLFIFFTLHGRGMIAVEV